MAKGTTKTRRKASAGSPAFEPAQDPDPIIVTTFRLRRSQLDQLQDAAAEHSRSLGLTKKDTSLLLRQKILPEWFAAHKK